MKFIASTRAAGALAAALSSLLIAAPAQANGTVVRVSVTANGGERALWSSDQSISSDGDRIAFQSALPPGGSTNGIFVRDRDAQDTIAISVTPNGDQGNGDSFEPRISRNGEFVVYTSTSSDLVAGDNNGEADVFVTEIDTGATDLVSVAAGGGPSAAGAGKPSVSAGGRYIAFQSSGNDLDSNAPADSRMDVFVRDMLSGTTTQVNMFSNNTKPSCVWDYLCDGTEPEISADGEYVVFESAGEYTTGATNLSLQIYRATLDTGAFVRVTRPHANADPQDAVGGGEPQISSDGSVVVYSSSANGLVPGDSIDTFDIFAFDFSTQTTTRASTTGGSTEPNGSSYTASVSPDGSRVGFTSYADNLDSNDTNGSSDGFVYNRSTGNVNRVTVAQNGAEGDWDSFMLNFADNQTVAFTSLASNLIASDTNDEMDVFVKSL